MTDPALDPVPDPVHIDDYAAPEFSPEVAEMIGLAAPMADLLPLEVDAICDQAVGELSAAGRRYEDFGDPGFRDRMALLLAAYQEVPELSPMGRITVHTLFVQLCRNRLLVEDLFARHPEAADVEIVAPIIIAGLPRTGTTHLHNLLAADPALRSLPYWESCEPIPLPTDAPAPGAPDPRWTRTAAACDFLDAAMPLFKRMHEMTPNHVHEEIQLLAIDFSSMLFETLAPIERWRDRFLATDQAPHYAYLRRVLQAITFLDRAAGRPDRRWVLKSPQHLEQYRAIASVFPDATVVITHRDPVAVTASMATMLAYTSRLQLDPVDPARIGGYWLDRLHRMLGSALEHRGALAPERSLDVRFDDFMADDPGTLAAIYELAGQPLDDAARRGHEAYRSTHGRGRHGGLVYDLADFGIDVDDCRSRFAPYVARFLDGGAANA